MEIKRVPPSPNKLRRLYRHFQAYRRLRELWQTEIFAACSTQRQEIAQIAKTLNQMNLVAAIKHAKLKVSIHQRRKRLLDPDNLVGSLKPVLDALVRQGVLKDDSAEHIELQSTQELCGSLRPSTEIVIEEVKA